MENSLGNNYRWLRDAHHVTGVDGDATAMPVPYLWVSSARIWLQVQEKTLSPQPLNKMMRKRERSHASPLIGGTKPRQPRKTLMCYYCHLGNVFAFNDPHFRTSPDSQDCSLSRLFFLKTFHSLKCIPLSNSTHSTWQSSDNKSYQANNFKF